MTRTNVQYTYVVINKLDFYAGKCMCTEKKIKFMKKIRFAKTPIPDNPRASVAIVNVNLVYTILDSNDMTQ